MDRRRFIAFGIAAAAGTAGLTACQGNGPGATTAGGGSGGGGAKNALTVYCGADTNIQDLWTKTLIPGFEKANQGTKITFQFDLHGQNSDQVLNKIAAATQQKKDPGIDFLESMGDRAGEAGLLADPSGKVANLTGVLPDLQAAAAKNSIPYRGSSVLLAYLPDKVGTPPKSLDELLVWIKKNPGKFAYNSPDTGGAGDSFVQTVLTKYLSAADLKTMTTGYHKDLEGKWDKGFATLAGLNTSMYQKGVYPNGNNGTLELLLQKEIWMCPAWSDQFISGRKSGVVPKEAEALQITDPSFTGGGTYAGVLSASTKQDAAFKLANWLLEPTQQAAIATAIAGYPAIAMDKLPGTVKSEFADADPGNLRPGFNSDMDADMKNLWQQKVPGN
ncbi:extracellular solute-binding protein [Microlunatus soli]|uniref:Putative spermidine/putrescine transport system substrate-binding protein n=1 Tax=Microlunatus soli TaxID=630515 RepID=A0A1H1Y8X8_9ACTN|nr:extracellular solute-binding protein [Microlunatus soli]SDT17851.1 putative spermidine/putrescine transport system substrate-binding protein [Microlunatus soli]